LKEAQRAGAAVDYEYNEEAFTLTRGKTLMNLGNLYLDYLQEHADSCRAENLNSWQTAMYAAAAISNWFCRGGFAQR
jgi:hypothetical protein